MQRLTTLSTYGTFESEEGKITLVGSLRVSEEGVDEFRVELPGRLPMYGEWRPIFELNGNDFNVTIVTFGYVDAFNVGNLHPNSREIFSRDDAAKIKKLILALFASPEARVTVGPFNGMTANYLGKVDFCDGWISA